MKRREFLLGLASSPLALLARRACAQATGRYSIVLGPTDANSFEISVLHLTEENLRYFVRFTRSGLVRPSQKIKRVSWPNSKWSVSTVLFHGLPDYEPVEVLIEDEQGLLKDVRGVRWLDHRNKRPRVLVGSCAAGYLYNSEIWSHLNQSNPDLVFFLGDNVYADRPNLVTKRPANPEQIWASYVAARCTYGFYFRRELVPTVATWDDHDFGLDEGDQTYAYKHQSREIFNSFWPQRSTVIKDLESGPGVTTRFSAFGMDFIFLDTRTFRGPFMWGDEQSQWLAKQIRRSQRPLWLANGQQFFGGRGDLSLNGGVFQDEYEWLIDLIREHQRPVAFLSGDVHYSETLSIESKIFGYPTWEITSSSLHSVTLPGQHLLFSNPRRQNATSRYNFVLLDMTALSRFVDGVVRCIGSTGETVFRHGFSFGYGEAQDVKKVLSY